MTPTFTGVRRRAHTFALSGCMTMLFWMTVTTSSCTRWTMTTTANRTTSTRSGCTSLSTCVLSRRSTHVTRPSHTCCTTSRSPIKSRRTSPSPKRTHPRRPAHLANTLQHAAHQARGRYLALLQNNGRHHVLTIERAPDADPCPVRRSPARPARQRHLRIIPTKDEGGVLLHRLSGRL